MKKSPETSWSTPHKRVNPLAAGILAFMGITAGEMGLTSMNVAAEQKAIIQSKNTARQCATWEKSAECQNERDIIRSILAGAQLRLEHSFPHLQSAKNIDYDLTGQTLNFGGQVFKVGVIKNNTEKVNGMYVLEDRNKEYYVVGACLDCLQENFRAKASAILASNKLVSPNA